MSKGAFFVFIDRLKYISRWGLMRNTLPENVQGHSMQVAVLANALASIGREIYKKSDVDPGLVASAALFHDCSEIFTGDLPTPVKYKNDGIKAAYKDVERSARERLCGMLPRELEKSYGELIFFEEQNPGLYRYIKAADKLSAYIKCLEETASGNSEFKNALAENKKTVETMALTFEELKWFLENILPSYCLTIDELSR